MSREVQSELANLAIDILITDIAQDLVKPHPQPHGKVLPLDANAVSDPLLAAFAKNIARIGAAAAQLEKSRRPS